MVNITGLVDTNVSVDVLRNYLPAVTWLNNQPQLGIARAVWFEVIEGAQNLQEQRRSLRLLRRFTVVEMEPEDGEWAAQALLKFNLSHNVDTMDCLIAAVSHRLQIPLYTHNTKHFLPLLGSLIRKPY